MTRTVVMMLGALSLAGCAGMSGGRAGLISRGMFFCNVNYPNGLQGVRKTLVQANANYANWTPDVQAQMTDRIRSALAAHSSPTSQFVYPGQPPYDLIIHMTEYRTVPAGSSSEADCAAAAVSFTDIAGCEGGGNETRWIGITVAADRGWMFDLYSTSWQGSSHAEFDARFDPLADSVAAMLANGWKCTADGRAFQ